MTTSERNTEGRGMRWLAIATLAWICFSWIASRHPGMDRVALASLALLPAVLVHISLTYPSTAPFIRSFPLAIGVPYLVCAVPAAIGLRVAVGNHEAESTLTATTLGLSALACALLIPNLFRAASVRQPTVSRFAARLGLAGLAFSIASMITASWWPPLAFGMAGFPAALVIGSARGESVEVLGESVPPAP